MYIFTYDLVSIFADIILPATYTSDVQSRHINQSLDNWKDGHVDPLWGLVHLDQKEPTTRLGSRAIRHRSHKCNSQVSN